MLILLTVIGIAGIIAAIIMYNKFDIDFGSCFVTAICITLLIGVVIGFCVCGTDVVSGKYIDNKISMYEDENANIEQRVAESINAYLAHETKIYDNINKQVNPESAITIVAAYPELNSSALIAKQIEIYNSNNAEIKRLKEKQIDMRVSKWWIYFGN